MVWRLVFGVFGILQPFAHHASLRALRETKEMFKALSWFKSLTV